MQGLVFFHSEQRRNSRKQHSKNNTTFRAGYVGRGTQSKVLPHIVIESRKLKWLLHSALMAEVEVDYMGIETYWKVGYWLLYAATSTAVVT
jgi:hypothetical protein